MVVIRLTDHSILENAILLCLKNAKQYIKDAEILFSFKSYGHALALTVLSDVELGKAVIYHLWVKDLISEEMLPPPFQSYFRKRQYEQLASETWWVGLVIASNVEDLVGDLLDASELTGEAISSGEKLSLHAAPRIAEVIKRMELENDKLKELEVYRAKGFFVNFSVHDSYVASPALVENTLVKVRIQEAKKRIRFGTPFLSMPLSETPKRIGRLLVGEAFKSVLPLRDRISQFVLPARQSVLKD